MPCKNCENQFQYAQLNTQQTELILDYSPKDALNCWMFFVANPTSNLVVFQILWPLDKYRELASQRKQNSGENCSAQ